MAVLLEEFISLKVKGQPLHRITLDQYIDRLTRTINPTRSDTFSRPVFLLLPPFIVQGLVDGGHFYLICVWVTIEGVDSRFVLERNREGFFLMREPYVDVFVGEFCELGDKVL